MRRTTLLALALPFLLAGCGEGGESSGSLVTVPTSVCSSGLKWSGGTEDGSSKMLPGHDCMGCHGFDAAGTVYAGFNEANDCAGVQGLTITITDANGASYSMTSNLAGNFHLKGVTLAYPITASVSDGVTTRSMATPQYTAACNSCHTATGLNGAPGRVVAPQ